MHTDRKIGFAMGILLIGIVAALFFRNEPLVNRAVPAVRRERELNQTLRERDAPVYMKDDREETAADNDGAAGPEPDENEQPWTLRDVLRNMDARNKSMPSPVGSARIRKPGIPDVVGSRRPNKNSITTRSEERSDRAQVADRSLADEETQSFDSPPDRLAPIPLPPLPRVTPAREGSIDERPTVDATHVKSDSPQRAKVPSDLTTQDLAVPAAFDEYEVRYGDTLSGIAQKFLGAQSRYREIYEANRDRMESPDRLDVGKPIRIPRPAPVSP